MIHHNLFTILAAISLTIGGSEANSTGLGSITGPVSGVGSDTGLREFVPLHTMGNLLIGRPVDSSIELIVINAPDYREKETHLMLRELKTQNGIRSLLFTASETLDEHLRRITIYSRETDSEIVLLERHGESWKYHTPQTIQSTAHIKAVGDKQLFAFPLDRLGLYWVSSSLDIKTGTYPPLEPTASALLGGRVNSGLLPWGASILLLIIIMSLSHWVYLSENRKSR